MKKNIVASMLFALAFLCNAQNNMDLKIESNTAAFIENKGQWNNLAFHKAQFNSGAIYAEKDKLTVHLFDNIKFKTLVNSSNESTASNMIKSHVFNMQFMDCNFVYPNNFKQDETTYTESYFINSDANSWKKGLVAHSTISYQNIYNNIDANVSINNSSIGYQFTLKPTAEASDLKISFQGLEGIQIQNDTVIVKTTFGNMYAKDCKAYQIIKGEKKKIICNISQENNILFFNASQDYDKQLNLYISCEFEFPNQNKLTQDNGIVISSISDIKGNYYLGSSYFTSEYPNTIGISSVPFSEFCSKGNFDILITKFNFDAKKTIYRTIIGGSDFDLLHGLTLDKSSNVFLFGTTGSSNFPTSEQAFDRLFNGGTKNTQFNSIANIFRNGTDLFLTKINEQGNNVLGSTFVGGSENDGLNYLNNIVTDENGTTLPKVNIANNNDQKNTVTAGQIKVDNFGNPYIASSTRSGNFPIMHGFDNVFNGVQDGVIVKFRADLGSLIYSSFVGGSDEDNCTSLFIENENSIFLTGNTSSNDLSFTQNGYQKQFNGGATDAYLLNIGCANDQVFGGTYVGTDQLDLAFAIQMDKSQNIVLLGQSLGDMPVQKSISDLFIFSVPNTRQYLSAYSKGLNSLEYSTVFGANNNAIDVDFTSFIIDQCDNIFITSKIINGNNLNTSLLPTTSDPIANSPFHFMWLQTRATSIKYASYFNADNNTNSESCLGDVIINNNFKLSKFTCNNDNIQIKEFQDLNDKLITTKSIINADKLSGCAPLKVNFTSDSRDNSLIWDFGNRNTSKASKVQQTYEKPGIYLVTLKTSNPASCNKTDSASVYIQVNATPIAKFTTNNASCSNTVQFVNLTNNFKQSVSYTWDFDDGSTKNTEENPLYFYNQNKEYNISLSAKSELGCSSNYSAKIPVLNSIVEVTGGGAVVCAGSKTQLLANGGAKYVWTPNESLNNPNINNPIASPSVSTIYTVSVFNPIGSSECISTQTLELAVELFADFTFEYTSCADSIIRFTNTTFNMNAKPVAYEWDFDDDIANPITEESPEYQFKNNGVHNITLKVKFENGCTSIAKKKVTSFYFKPTVVDPLIVCDHVKRTLFASGGTSYLWKIPGQKDVMTQSIVVNPSVSTTYNVLIKNNSFGVNCSQELTTDITVDDALKAGFTLDFSTCSNTLIATNTTESSPESPATYIWNFDDGDTESSIEESLEYTFKRNGKHNITLVANAANGCISKFTQTINVFNFEPTIIAPTPLCAGATRTIVATGGTSYNWKQAKNLTNTSAALIVQPKNNTTYVVKIKNNSMGYVCSADLEAEVPVIEDPKADFTIESTKCANTVQLTNATEPNGEDSFTYLWNFDENGVTSIEESPAYTFEKNGMHKISLTVSSSSGCQSTKTTTLSVFNFQPIISEPATICAGTTKTLVASGGTSYYWRPSTSLNNNLNNTVVAKPKSTTTYIVKVKNSSMGYDCLAELSSEITVNTEPVANFDMVYTPCANTVQLNNLSKATDVTPTYFWNFDDNGATSNDESPEYTFERNGVHKINLKITADNGCTSETTKTLSIFNFQPTVIEAGTACLNSTRKLNATGGTSYLWSPATGLDNPNIANPTAIVSETSNYTVRILNTALGNNCEDELTTDINVELEPLANFDVNYSPCSNTIQIVNTSQTSNIEATYFWNFDDGGVTSIEEAPEYTYINEGTHNINLTIKGANGCSSTLTKSIVLMNFVPTVSEATTICLGLRANLLAEGGTSYLWTPNTFLNNSNISKPISTPNETTEYSVLIKNKRFGLECEAELNTEIAILNEPAAAFDVVYSACSNTIELQNKTNTPNALTTFAWHFDDGDNGKSEEESLAYTFENEGKHNILLTATGDNGCTSTASKVIVLMNFAPEITPDTTICFNSSAIVNVSGGTSYAWVASPFIKQLTPISASITPRDSVNVIVKAINNRFGLNCSTDLQMKVLAYNGPKANFNTLFSKCSNTLQLENTTDKGDEETVTYQWQINDGALVTLEEEAPLYSFVTNGVHLITLTATGVTNECSTTLTKSVTVFDFKPAVATTSDICLGTSTILEATGGNSYIWSPNISISDVRTATPIVNPVMSTIYKVIVQNNEPGYMCSEQFEVPVEVLTEPKANFIINYSPCTNSVELTNLTPNPKLTNEYIWNFDDGQNSTSKEESPSYIYNSNGTHNITLKALGDNGCESTFSKIVTLAQMKASVNPDAVICGGMPYNLKAKGGTGYLWKPSNTLNNPYISSPITKLKETTTFTVIVKNFVNKTECLDTLTTTVEVYSGLQVNFEYTSAQCTKTVQFTNTTIGDVKNATYTWEFDEEGGTSTEVNPTYIFKREGIRKVKLTVNNSSSCPATITKTISVLFFEPSISPNITVCKGSVTQLSVTGGNSYEWSPNMYLSDARSSHPSVRPSQSMLYKASIKKSGYGVECTANLLTQITIESEVKADFTFDFSPCTNTIALTFADFKTADKSLKFAWDLDEGEAPIAIKGNKPFLYTFKRTGKHNISLTAVTSNSCTIKKSKIITVLGTAIQTSTITSQTICQGVPTQLSASGGSEYEWLPTTGLNNNRIAKPVIKPETSQIYTVTIKTKIGETTCEATQLYKLTVVPNTRANFNYEVNPCTNEIKFTDSSLPKPKKWYWSFGDNTFSTSQNISHNYTESGTYSFYLKTETDKGCLDSTGIKSENIIVRETSRIVTHHKTINDTITLVSMDGDTYSCSPDKDVVNSSTRYPKTATKKNAEYTVKVMIANSKNTCETQINNRIFVHKTITYSTVVSNSSNNLKYNEPYSFTLTPDMKNFKMFEANPAVIYDVANDQISFTPTISGVYGFGFVDKANNYRILSTPALTIAQKPECNNSFISVTSLVTPNGDNQNDVVKISADITLAQFQININDEKGTLVFESTDINAVWDAKIKKQPVAKGIYKYKIFYSCDGNSDIKTKSGIITVE